MLNKALLKKVQHRFSQMFPELKSLPYEQRLDKLGLWTLEERRNRADLLEIFKLIKGFTAVSWTHFFTRIGNGTTRGHNWKLMKKHNCFDLRHHFFSQRAVNRWNSLSRYDSVHLTCNQKLTGSQLSLLHGTNKKFKCKTKNKMIN